MYERTNFLPCFYTVECIRADRLQSSLLCTTRSDLHKPLYSDVFFFSCKGNLRKAMEDVKHCKRTSRTWHRMKKDGKETSRRAGNGLRGAVACVRSYIYLIVHVCLCVLACATRRCVEIPHTGSMGVMTGSHVPRERMVHRTIYSPDSRLLLNIYWTACYFLRFMNSG